MAKNRTRTAARSSRAKKQTWYVTLDPFEVCIQKKYPTGACNFEILPSFRAAQERALEYLYDLAADCARRAGCIKHAHNFEAYRKLCGENLK